MIIFWKGTVSADFRTIRPKLWRTCTFPWNFYTRKLGEISLFYAVLFIESNVSNGNLSLGKVVIPLVGVINYSKCSSLAICSRKGFTLTSFIHCGHQCMTESFPKRKNIQNYTPPVIPWIAIVIFLKEESI